MTKTIGYQTVFGYALEPEGAKAELVTTMLADGIGSSGVPPGRCSST